MTKLCFAIVTSGGFVQMPDKDNGAPGTLGSAFIL